MEPLPPNPVPLGPFDVDQDGILALREPPARARLHFRWRGRACEAALLPDGMRLSVIAGRIPSTASPGAGRAGSFAALRALQGEMPAGWRLGLMADHRIRLEREEAIGSPASPVGLIAALVAFALGMDPMLDRLEAAGTEPAYLC